MGLKCPDCGVSVMSLMAHRCGRAKGSPELEAAFKILLPKSLPKSARIAGSGGQPKARGGASPEKKIPPIKTDVVEVVYERHVKHENDGLETKGDASLASRGPEAQNIGASNSKRGRPRIEDRDKTIEALEPWKAAGMSRTSWYNRRRLSEQRSKEGGK
jgi:hypothetical protein